MNCFGGFLFLVRMNNMKYILLIVSLLIFNGCSLATGSKNVTKIFSMEEVVAAGIKSKGDFETKFPESTDAKWGFFDGREVAILRYPTVDLANTAGNTTAIEQTEKIEVVEKNIAHGLKVEKTKCRGYKPGVGVSGRGGLKLSSSFNANNALSGVLITNKLILLETDAQEHFEAAPCVRREPMYTEFIIHGNLVIMAEPLPTEDSDGTIKFLDKMASNLK